VAGLVDIELEQLLAADGPLHRDLRDVLEPLRGCTLDSISGSDLAHCLLSSDAIARRLGLHTPEARVLFQMLAALPRTLRSRPVLATAIAFGRDRGRHARPVDLLRALLVHRLSEALRAVSVNHALAPSMSGAGHADGTPVRANGRAEGQLRLRSSEGEPAPTPTLDEWGVDLIAAAETGRLEPVVARDQEIARLLEVLCRPSKRNAILIGDAGVGKTAVVAGLAHRMATGDIPGPLQDARLIALDAEALRTAMHHSHEVAQLIREIAAEAAATRAILFLDEFHVACRPRYYDETPIAAQLKPALARGDVAVIGATTVAEYAAHVEADAALARRFETITIDEPPQTVVEEMVAARLAARVSGLGRRREVARGVVALAARHLLNRRFPDKALDVVERAAVRADLEHRDFDERVIEEVVGELRGYPLGDAAVDLRVRLPHLAADLGRAVIGQSDAVNAVADRLMLTLSDLDLRAERPRAVMLFTGPSGTGKTELGRAIARALFGDERRLVRIDLAEYAPLGSIYRLIGGRRPDETGTPALEAIAANPFSVLLLDEFDKACAEVQLLWLGAFDVGRLTTGRGRTVDLRGAVIVLTSNHLAQRPKPPLGFVNQPGQRSAAEDVADQLPPELVGRMDAVVRFRSLGVNDAEEILERLVLPAIGARCGALGVDITVSAEARSWIAEHGFSPRFGVRDLERVAEMAILSPVARLLAVHTPPLSVRAGVTNERVVVEPVPDSRRPPRGGA
jgi:ATP-dependent Clp protease ATP-binding subunit ClpC